MFQGVSRNPNAMDLSGVNDVRARSFLLQHAHHYGLVMLLDDNPEKSCQCGGMGLKCGWKFLCVHTSRFMPLSVDKSWDSVRNKNHCAKCRRQLTPQIHYNSYITLIVKFFFDVPKQDWPEKVSNHSNKKGDHGDGTSTQIIEHGGFSWRGGIQCSISSNQFLNEKDEGHNTID